MTRSGALARHEGILATRSTRSPVWLETAGRALPGAVLKPGGCGGDIGVSAQVCADSAAPFKPAWRQEAAQVWPVPRPMWSAPGQPALRRVCLASGTQSSQRGLVEGLVWGTQARGCAAGDAGKGPSLQWPGSARPGSAAKRGEAFRTPHALRQGQGDTVGCEGGEVSGQGRCHRWGRCAEGCPCGRLWGTRSAPGLGRAGPPLSLVKLGDSHADGHRGHAGRSTSRGPSSAQARLPARGLSATPPTPPTPVSLEKRDFSGNAAERWKRLGWAAPLWGRPDTGHPSRGDAQRAGPAGTKLSGDLGGASPQGTCARIPRTASWRAWRWAAAGRSRSAASPAMTRHSPGTVAQVHRVPLCSV